MPYLRHVVRGPIDNGNPKLDRLVEDFDINDYGQIIFTLSVGQGPVPSDGQPFSGRFDYSGGLLRAKNVICLEIGKWQEQAEALG